MNTLKPGLSISPRVADRAIVITFHDRALTFPTTSALYQGLTRVVQRAVAHGHRHVVFNWKHVATLDSSGLGLMLIAHQIAEEHDSQVYLCRISRMITKFLYAMGIGDRFKVLDTEEQALEDIRAANRRERGISVAPDGYAGMVRQRPRTRRAVATPTARS